MLLLTIVQPYIAAVFLLLLMLLNCTIDKVDLLNSRACLSNIAKEINGGLLKNAK